MFQPVALPTTHTIWSAAHILGFLYIFIYTGIKIYRFDNICFPKFL
jgi:hypothetical protein